MEPKRKHKQWEYNKDCPEPMRKIFWEISNNLLFFTYGTIFAFGIILAGQDGPWFPWVNFIGLAMMFFVAVKWSALR